MSTDPVVEAMAQMQFKYSQLAMENSKELQANARLTREAHARVSADWEHVVKPGQTWNQGDDPVRYKQFLDKICTMHAQSLDEYVYW
jgi:hypothetical protein